MQKGNKRVVPIRRMKAMRYLGGKTRIAKELVSVMQPFIAEASCYVEPFVGGANVICKVSKDKRIAADANEALINMWKAFVSGWVPPDNLSEEEYKTLKAVKDPNNPLTAFAGFGCAFSGTWFTGYAKNKRGTNYAAETKRSMYRQLPGLTNIDWISCDYRNLNIPPKSLVYCDPPYSGKIGYLATGVFDNEAFWEYCRKLTFEGILVFISERSAPEDFSSILQIHKKSSLVSKDNTSKVKNENLYVHSSIANTVRERLTYSC